MTLFRVLFWVSGVLLLARRLQAPFLSQGTATEFCILNETISRFCVYSLHKPPVICVLVLLPLVCQIDHMVQNHPAHNQVQAQAQQRWVDLINNDLLNKLLAQS